MVELVGISDTSWQKGCLGETETRDGAVETRVDDLGDWIRASTAAQPQGLREPVTGEFTRDGVEDLIAADSAGKLWLYPGTADRTRWGTRIDIGTGWSPYREFAVGRINRDQYDDLLAIETASQKLWLYPGTATGGRFGTRVEYGSGWGPFRDIAIGRVNADAYDDLLTVKDTDSKLYLYKGNAGGAHFDAGVAYGTGWNCCAQLTLGRYNDDDFDDLLTVDKATGRLRLYAGRADGTQFVPGVDPGAGATWASSAFLTRGRFDGSGLDGLLKVDATSGQTALISRTAAGAWNAAVPPVGRVVTPTPADLTKIAVGELNRDAYQDLIGVDPAGLLWLYPGTAANTWGPRVQVGSGWANGRELVIAKANRDNFDDLIALEISTAKQWLYPGTAAGTIFGVRQQIGSGWGPHHDIAIGRVNRDDFDDLLSISDADNKLYLYKGNAAGGHFDAAVGYGTGWNCCTQVTLGSFNGDEFDDLLTVDKATGKLRLYGSKADGSQFDPSVDPGAGDRWANRTELVGVRFAAGQHDGLLAKDPSGELLLFPATPKGSPDWADPVRIGPRD
ncbi:VCBS repeat-containing protein [Actinoplanes sp. NPDC051633]|uniref:VCBS repeat-containing protein n=1 Tax=Actinoplanes sp. NPDC051633 TaxID=3155670 RepID=UPI0034480961